MHVITPFLLVGAGVCLYLVAVYTQFIISDRAMGRKDEQSIFTKFFSGKLYMDIGVKDAPIASWGPINQAIAAVIFLYLAVALEMNMLPRVMKWINIVVLLYLAGALFYEYNIMSKAWPAVKREAVLKYRDHSSDDQQLFNLYSSIITWLDYDGPSSLAVGLLCLVTAGYLGGYEKLKGLVLKSNRR